MLKNSWSFQKSEGVLEDKVFMINKRIRERRTDLIFKQKYFGYTDTHGMLSERISEGKVIWIFIYM